MYKVLLVDDERIILEGISSIVNWEQQGTVLVGTARNGIEALEFISEEQPHIVITDITMPGLDGLKLIEMGKETYPSIKWILLTGFSEFEYARKAMSFGVKHYLLKPCNEDTISHALKKVVLELEQIEEQSTYMKNVENELGHRTNEKSEELLKQLFNLDDMELAEERVNHMCKVFKLHNDKQKLRLLLFRLERNITSENMLTLKRFFYETFKNVVTYTIEKNLLFLLIKDYYEQEKLSSLITQFRDIVYTDYHITITTVISNTCEITDLPLVYIEMLKKLDECFYLGIGNIISFKVPLHSTDDSELYKYDYEKLIQMLKCGCIHEANDEIRSMMNKIETLKISPYLVKSYFTHLYLTIAKANVYLCSEDRIKDIVKIDNIKLLRDFLPFFEEIFKNFYSHIRNEATKRYSDVVLNLIKMVEENIEHPDLSIQWIASKKLYMNADYLGKLFKKEAGQKFSTYVTNKRIEKAVEMIQKERNIKVFELAEKLGFGDNPQYFSQIFKKVTGVTPSDIMKLP
ncbi:MAG: response regulator [Anaerobacillus sp.]|uniref:response regulator transcription factor n=1 Tax=Anaerobacillus sp. TaxID=1872506 RepID=UPI00391DD62B